MKTMILRLLLIALYPFLAMMASAQPQTDRERAGLSGTVYSVTTYRKTITENKGVIAETPILLESRDVYDRTGNRRERILYGPNGLSIGKIIYLYDIDEKRLVGGRVSDENDRIIRIVEFGYGTERRLSSQTNYEYDQDGLLIGRIVIVIDKYGELMEIKHYNAEGFIVRRDSFPRRPLNLNETLNETLLAKETEPDKGRPTLNREKPKYEYDSGGIWIQRASKGFNITKSGEKVMITRITYRTIHYHD